MFWALIYVAFGACLSAFVAGRYIKPDVDRGRLDPGAMFAFIIFGSAIWPILVPVFFAFRAGSKRSS